MTKETISVAKLKEWIEENMTHLWFDGCESDDLIYYEDLLEFIEKESKEE